MKPLWENDIKIDNINKQDKSVLMVENNKINPKNEIAQSNNQLPGIYNLNKNIINLFIYLFALKPQELRVQQFPAGHIFKKDI